MRSGTTGKTKFYTIKISLIGAYLLAFMVALVAISIWTYHSDIDDTLIKSLIYVGISGGLGGTIYCMRGFYKNLADNMFKLNWTWWYIFRPFISIVIGVFVYFLIVGGIISLGSVCNLSYSRGIMFYCAVAFLSGFSFTQFADKLEELSSTLFSKK